MNTIAQYDKASIASSRAVTGVYSTSFSIAIRSLHPSMRDPIHAIYGFVRLADEIVDTFHDHDKRQLLDRFRQETDRAVEEGISLNPILQSFQKVVKQYGIEAALYHDFLKSMAMDLTDRQHDRSSYENYIFGSAEVVGAMCLRVFCQGNDDLYAELRPAAMRLGAAFQKLNFLRDHKDDLQALGRSYFPGLSGNTMDRSMKEQIEKEIRADLEAALPGIRRLPEGARFGVYTAYMYYYALFKKIGAMPIDRILHQRIRIPDHSKLAMLSVSYVRHKLGRI